jgi:uncharacterized membrane protein
MDQDQQIRELQEKINKLSKNIHLFEQEIQLMRAQLNALQQKEGGTVYNRIRAGEELPVITRTNTGFENYIGLRVMHIIGIIVLVTGLSIGVKYAIDKQLISAAMRIVLAYSAGVVLFVLSLRLKKKYLLFSAILFSGSMASVYFTTYAAFVYYNFFPGFVAFGIMTALTAYTVYAAMSYNRQEIAILGMIGAYGIPFLVSANAERVDLFFSYILLINIGVAFISFKRSWKWMQYLALLITWTLFIGWELIRYQSSEQSLGILFMIAYYLLFLFSAAARHFNRSSFFSTQETQQVLANNIALYMAAVLIFGNGTLDTNLASTTGFIALFIALLALAVVFLFPSEITLQRMLSWQAIVLLVFFIGFQWEGLTVTLLWLAVAVSLFTWGALDKKSWPRLASILLIGVTLGKLIIFDSADFSTVQKIVSFLVIGILLLLFSFYYQKYNLLNKKTDGE